MPKVEFRSNARPSLFGYTPPLEEKKKDDREKVATAVLSIAARAKKRGVSTKHVIESESTSNVSDSTTASVVPSATAVSVSAASVSTTSNAAEKMEVVSIQIC